MQHIKIQKIIKYKDIQLPTDWSSLPIDTLKAKQIGEYFSKASQTYEELYRFVPPVEVSAHVEKVA